MKRWTTLFKEKLAVYLAAWVCVLCFVGTLTVAITDGDSTIGLFLLAGGALETAVLGVWVVQMASARSLTVTIEGVIHDAAERRETVQ